MYLQEYLSEFHTLADSILYGNDIHENSLYIIIDSYNKIIINISNYDEHLDTRTQHKIRTTLFKCINKIHWHELQTI